MSYSKDWWYYLAIKIMWFDAVGLFRLVLQEKSGVKNLQSNSELKDANRHVIGETELSFFVIW